MRGINEPMLEAMKLTERSLESAAIRDELSAFFAHCGLTDVDLREPAGNGRANMIGYQGSSGWIPVAAAASYAPSLVVVTLRKHGMSLQEARETAVRIHALGAIAVDPVRQGIGLGSHLLGRVEKYAVSSRRAEHLIAAVDAADVGLHDWYRSRGYRIARPGQVLYVEGVPLPRDENHLDIWKPLETDSKLDIMLRRQSSSFFMSSSR